MRPLVGSLAAVLICSSTVWGKTEDVPLARVLTRLPEPVVRVILQRGWGELGKSITLDQLRSELQRTPVSEEHLKGLGELFACCEFAHKAELAETLLHVSDLLPGHSLWEGALLDGAGSSNADRRLRLALSLAAEQHNPALIQRLLDSWASPSQPLPSEANIESLLWLLESVSPERRATVYGRILDQPEWTHRGLIAMAKEISRGAKVDDSLRAKMERLFLKRFEGPKMEYELFLAAAEFGYQSKSQPLLDRVSKQLQFGRLPGHSRWIAEAVTAPLDEEGLRRKVQALRQQLLEAPELPSANRKRLLAELNGLQREAMVRSVDVSWEGSLRLWFLDSIPSTPELINAPENLPPIEELLEATLKSSMRNRRSEARVEDFLQARPGPSDPAPVTDDPNGASAINYLRRIRFSPPLAFAFARANLALARIEAIVGIEGSSLPQAGYQPTPSARRSLFWRLALREIALIEGSPSLSADRARISLINPTSDIYRKEVVGALRQLIGSLEKQLQEKNVQREVRDGTRSQPKPNETLASDLPAEIAGFVRDRTAEAKRGQLDPVIGREEEIRSLVTALQRRQKGSALLVGDPGVGKTAIAEELSRRIALGQVPPALQGYRVLELTPNRMTSGTKYRGEFEARAEALINYLTSGRPTILFIDEAHQMMGAGSAEGSAAPFLDALKPHLARGDVRIIAATDPTNFRQMESDPALLRRFQVIHVAEPSAEATRKILTSQAQNLERHHRVRIELEAIETAARLAGRYLTDRKLPDSALDLLDQAAAEVALQQGGSTVESARSRFLEIGERATANAKRDLAELYRLVGLPQVGVQALVGEAQAGSLVSLGKSGELSSSTRPLVTAENVQKLLSRLSGIPVGSIDPTEQEGLGNLEERLSERVVGQRDALRVVSDTVRRIRTGIQNPGKPPSLLFVGPTGVGKTELAKALAHELFGSSKAMTRLDMSEYMEPHSVAKLIGSGPGYVGFEEGGKLTGAVRHRPYQIILIDEVEKAHPAVHQLFLQLLEDGRLTDGRGKTADFRNTIVILTSNLGSAQLAEEVASPKIGFRQAAGAVEHRTLEQAIAGAFRPELINRIDEIVQFGSLTRADLGKIVDIQVASLRARLAEKGTDLVLTDAAKSLLADRGYDPRYNARPLRRLMQRTVENSLARLFVAGSLKRGTVEVDARGGSLVIRQEGRELSASEPEFSPSVSRIENNGPERPAQNAAKAMDVRSGGSTTMEELGTVSFSPGSGVSDRRSRQIGFRVSATESAPVAQVLKRQLGAAARGSVSAGSKFAVGAVGADVLVALLEGDREKLRNWREWADLRPVIANYLSLLASGTAADLFYKLGTGTVRGMSAAESLAQDLSKVRGVAGLSARVVPLWLALAGAPMLHGDSFQWKSALLLTPNIMAAHPASTQLVRAIRFAGTSFRGKGARVRWRAPIGLGGELGAQVLMFTMLHYLPEIEMVAVNALMEGRAKEQLAKAVKRLMRSVTTEEVTGNFANKRAEAESAFREVAAVAVPWALRDQTAALAERDERMETLRAEARGSIFRSAPDWDERQERVRQIDADCERRIRESEERRRVASNPIVKLPGNDKDLRAVAAQALKGTSDQVLESTRHLLDLILNRGTQYAIPGTAYLIPKSVGLRN